MRNLLYYPNISLPHTDWTMRALLYYDNVGAIVPMQYFYNPELYEPFMREMIRNELIIPIEPMSVLERPWEISQAFLEYISCNSKLIDRRRQNFHRIISRKEYMNIGTCVKIHIGKFDYNVLNEITQMGLAKRLDYNWFQVEANTAHELMTYLASVVSNSIGYLPATDRIDKSSFSATYLRNQDIELRARLYKRDMILKNLIPCPKSIDIYNLRRFKDEYRDLLETFRNKVELLVLNPVITPESPLFAETLNDMKSTKEELIARMNESRLGDIIFVTVCGVISAGLGFIAEPTTGAIPGLLNAIYSACQIEKPENITDQTGLKYLALVDKRLRK